MLHGASNLPDSYISESNVWVQDVAAPVLLLPLQL